MEIRSKLTIKTLERRQRRHCALSMLEKWKRAVDNRKAFELLVIDLKGLTASVTNVFF